MSKRVRSTSSKAVRSSKRTKTAPQRFRPGSDLPTEVSLFSPPLLNIFVFEQLLRFILPPLYFATKFPTPFERFVVHSRTSKVPPSSYKDGCGA